MREKQQITLVLSDEAEDLLSNLSEREMRTRSAIVTRALQRYAEREDRD